MVSPGMGKTGRRNNSITLSELPGQLPEELTHQAKLRKAVHKNVTESDVADVVKGITERAKEGNPQAVKNFMDYVLGEKTPITFIQNNYDGAEPVDSPAIEQPGTPEKIERMRNRVANGLPAQLNHDKNGR